MGFLNRFSLDPAAAALVALPLLALSTGLALTLAGLPDIAHWVFAAGVAPVLAVLIVTIIRALSRGEFGLDIIAALSMTGALLVGEMLAGAVVALMFAGGQALEAFAQGRAQREMTALLARVPRSAQVYGPNGLTETPLADIAPGNRVMVRSGEVVPVDGVVASLAAVLDESALTGEALPVRRLKGEAVSSGVANAGAAFDLTATRSAADSTYAGIVRLVEAARFSKAPMARLADRYALGFLAVTVGIAAAAWFLTGDARRALAVLVVATPCPLILAVPVAIVAGMSRSAGRGVLIKSARTLERLSGVRTILIDKTGTLTDGHAQLQDMEPVGGVSEYDLMRLAASLAQASQHVISQALVRAAKERGLRLSPPADVNEAHGDGLEGLVEGRRVRIGRPDYVIGHADPRELPPGVTALAVAVDGKDAGRLTFADRLREDAAVTMGRLRAAGVERVVLLTGDQPAIAEGVGAAIGADLVIASASPEQKVEAVRAEAARASVMMVGDGVNDAPALALADIGVALGARGAAAASEAADMVVLVDRIDRVADAMLIAARTRRIALESVFVGIGLSTLGMVAAAFGYLTPLAGALMQEAIDVAVILNALRALGGGAKTTAETPALQTPRDQAA